MEMKRERYKVQALNRITAASGLILCLKVRRPWREGVVCGLWLAWLAGGQTSCLVPACPPPHLAFLTPQHISLEVVKMLEKYISTYEWP